MAGVPALLLATGNPPLPGGLPTLDAARRALLRPDDGTLLLAVIRLLAWAGWLFVTGSLALEIAARVRRAPVPPLAGLGAPQALARGLIGAILHLATATPLAAAPEPAMASTVAAAPSVPVRVRRSAAASGCIGAGRGIAPPDLCFAPPVDQREAPGDAKIAIGIGESNAVSGGSQVGAVHGVAGTTAPSGVASLRTRSPGWPGGSLPTKLLEAGSRTGHGA